MSTAFTAAPSDVYAFALAGLMRVAAGCPSLDADVCARLQRRQGTAGLRGGSLLTEFKASLDVPGADDATLVEVARQFSLTLVEILSLRLAMAAEEDAEVAYVIAQLQAPISGHRPTIGLLARAFHESLEASAAQIIGHGEAVRTGVLRLSADEVPLVERQISIPSPTLLALQGALTPWPGTRTLALTMPVPLGREIDEAIDRLAVELSTAQQPEVLVVRSGEPLEARAAAAQLCGRMECPAVLVETDSRARVGAVAVHAAGGAGVRSPARARRAPAGADCAGVPGSDDRHRRHRRRVRERGPAHHRLADPDPVPGGSVRSLAPACERAARAPSRRRASALGSADRRAGPRGDSPRRPTATCESSTCRSHRGGSPTVSARSPKRWRTRCRKRRSSYRRSCGAISTIWSAAAGFVTDWSADSARRCARAIVPSVRALFVGPTGTGKTLAASWVATQLGLPLYRVDLSSVTSKYIGETEKNLSQLLGRAEANEIVLLFDEADSMFGKRTEVRDAHDRFANAQTNFLLQRLETYDGIVLLTSNSRARFDPAFARRLDLVLEFSPPGPDERRALWLAHLGDRHALTPADVNRVSAIAELSGGQIRAAVLSAAIHASTHDGTIRLADLSAGLRIEYRKMSRQLPEELQEAIVRT